MPTHLKYPTTCSIIRAFGGSVVASNVPCRIVDCKNKSIDFGQAGSPSSQEILRPTNILYCESNVDIRDGVTRSAGSGTITYADGDEIKVPSGGSTRYAVVFSEIVGRGTFGQQKKVYLIRHAVTWTGSDATSSPSLNPTEP